jgi:hypothetical protein
MDRAFSVVDGEMRIRIPTGIGIRNSIKANATRTRKHLIA